ncbi:hypothetical protein HYFRA_00001583 [Hymenoscyphus fraxineus]|uniref:Uncharacterized protein n=1 Tax=Hymenoscyphus fraxineus TaxID=746836 RepID=A0A9N9PY82_9HELO|nr:hypothetical protein HYFRA_00001583 [Hymenoscyphus fraxineus]
MQHNVLLVWRIARIQVLLQGGYHYSGSNGGTTAESLGEFDNDNALPSSTILVRKRSEWQSFVKGLSTVVVSVTFEMIETVDFEISFAALLWEFFENRPNLGYSSRKSDEEALCVVRSYLKKMA